MIIDPRRMTHHEVVQELYSERGKNSVLLVKIREAIKTENYPNKKAYLPGEILGWQICAEKVQEILDEVI